VGAGLIEQAIGVTVIVLLSLIILPYIEMFFARKYTKRTYKIVKKYGGEGLEKYEEFLKTYKLKIDRGPHRLEGDIISGTWDATGSSERHNFFVDAMLRDENILEFDF